MNSDSDPATALGQLLAAEAALLAAGDIEAAAKLATGKRAALDALMRAPAPDTATLAALRDRAERNLLRLGAAIKGVRSAQCTLRRIADRGATLTTYDSLGRTQTGPSAGALLARRY
jgi:hypothetical protein